MLFRIDPVSQVHYQPPPTANQKARRLLRPSLRVKIGTIYVASPHVRGRVLSNGYGRVAQQLLATALYGLAGVELPPLRSGDDRLACHEHPPASSGHAARISFALSAPAIAGGERSRNMGFC